MFTRVVTAVVGLLALIPVLIFSDTWIFPVALAFCGGVASFEMLRCVGMLKKYLITVPTIIFSIFIPFIVRLFSEPLTCFVLIVALYLIITLYYMGISVFSKGTVGFDKISITGFLCFYITLGFSSIIMLRDFFPHGKYMYLLVFVGAWVTDTFAYFCGMLFGKHKLIPEVSPKKTVEGSIGGTIFSGIGFVVFGIIINRIDIASSESYIKLFSYGAIAALVAQIGDLCMSALKRQYNIKDFGKLFPGHGGVLDRFDSIISVSLALLILEMFNLFI